MKEVSDASTCFPTCFPFFPEQEWAPRLRPGSTGTRRPWAACASQPVCVLCAGWGCPL